MSGDASGDVASRDDGEDVTPDVTEEDDARTDAARDPVLSSEGVQNLATTGPFSRHIQVPLDENRYLVLGGQTVNSNYNAAWAVLDFSQDRTVAVFAESSATTQFPVPLSAPIVIPQAGTFAVFGGAPQIVSVEEQNQVYRFDPAELDPITTLATATSEPIGPSGSAVPFGFNRWIVLPGQRSPPSDQVFEYNPSTETVGDLCRLSVNGSRIYTSSSIAIDPAIVIATGRIDNPAPNVLLLRDTSGVCDITETMLPAPSSGQAFGKWFAIDSELAGTAILVGGRRVANSATIDPVRETPIFSQTEFLDDPPMMNNAREGGASVQLEPGGRIVICGGVVDDENNATDECELFDPVTRTWRVIGTMLGRRKNGTLVWKEPFLYYVGGLRNDTLMNEIEILRFE